MAKVTLCDLCGRIDREPDPERAVKVGKQEWLDVCPGCNEDAVTMLSTLAQARSSNTEGVPQVSTGPRYLDGTDLLRPMSNRPPILPTDWTGQA